MKRIKVLACFVLAIFLLGVAAQASKVATIPSVGIKMWGTEADMYGKIGYDDNGNKFRYMKNGSGQIHFQGEPAFYAWYSGNDYTFDNYGATSSYESFAGIVYCDNDGDDGISSEAYGWVQISGIVSAYCSGEGGTAIAVGDTLKGSTTNGVNGVQDKAGGRFLTRDRAALTGSATPEFTEQAFARALATQAAATAATKINILLRSSY